MLSSHTNVDFSILPKELKKEIYSFAVDSEFSIHNLHIDESVSEFKNLALINKEGRIIVKKLFNDRIESVMSAITSQLGIILKEGVSPWQGYKNPLLFLQAIQELDGLFQENRAITKFITNIPKNNPILPHLVYLFYKKNYYEIKHVEILKQLVNAMNCGNISSAFARIHYGIISIDNKDTSVEQAQAIISTFLARHDIQFTEQDEQLFNEAFSHHAPGAIKLYQEFKTNKELYHEITETHSSLLASLVLSENPKQVLDFIISTQSFDKFKGEATDLALIEFLGKTIKGNLSEGLKNFIIELRNTVPNVKENADRATYWVPNRVKNDNDKLANQLQYILTKIDILEQNHHLIDFILEKNLSNKPITVPPKDPFIKKYLHIAFLVTYPELVGPRQSRLTRKNGPAYLSIANVKSIRDFMLDFLIQHQVYFKKWKQDDLVNFVLQSHTQEFCRAFKGFVDKLQDLSSEEIAFLNNLKLWYKNMNTHVHSAFGLMKNTTIKFVQDCHDYHADGSLLTHLSLKDTAQVLNFIDANGGIHNPKIFGLLAQEFISVEESEATPQSLTILDNIQSENMNSGQPIFYPTQIPLYANSVNQSAEPVSNMQGPSQFYYDVTESNTSSVYTPPPVILDDFSNQSENNLIDEFLFADELPIINIDSPLFSDLKLENFSPAPDISPQIQDSPIEDYSPQKNKQPVTNIKTEFQEEKPAAYSYSSNFFANQTITLFSNSNKRQRDGNDELHQEKRVKLEGDGFNYRR